MQLAGDTQYVYVGVYKPGEQIKEDSQASQRKPSEPGEVKMYNTSEQYKKTYHSLYNTFI